MKVRIESIGSVRHDSIEPVESIDLLEVASKECLERSKFISHDIDLILYSGIYRSNFLSEPAVAAILAKQLDLNARLQDTRRTFAFDVMNGGIGFFNACMTAINYLKTGESKAAMVATAEIENNRNKENTQLLGVNETAASIILELGNSEVGFGNFLVKNFTQEIDDRVTNLSWKEGTGMAYLDHEIKEGSEQRYITAICKALEAYVAKYDVSLDDYDVIIPPQMSYEFCEGLQQTLSLKSTRLISVFELVSTLPDNDFLTVSLPYAIKEGIDQGQIKPGDKALFICAGAGIQVGCIEYQF